LYLGLGAVVAKFIARQISLILFPTSYSIPRVKSSKIFGKHQDS
jgi:hypothetical protein